MFVDGYSGKNLKDSVILCLLLSCEIFQKMPPPCISFGKGIAQENHFNDHLTTFEGNPIRISAYINHALFNSNSQPFPHEPATIHLHMSLNISVILVNLSDNSPGASKLLTQSTRIWVKRPFQDRSRGNKRQVPRKKCIATRNKCHASSNKCLTSSNKKLVVTSATLVVTGALLVLTRS